MAPSWLPSWPAGWRDIISDYRRAVRPPRGLYRDGGEARLDWYAIAESLSMVGRLYEWILQSYHPQRDTEELQIDRWGETLRIFRGVGALTRRMLIVAKLRQRGTTTQDMVKQIFATAWGTMDPSTLTLYRQAPIAAGTEPTDTLQFREMTHIHIYQTAENDAPDWDFAEELIRLVAPTWATWSVGRYRRMRYGDPDSGWGRGCWG